MTHPYETSPEARMEAAIEKGLLKDADPDAAAIQKLLLTCREIASNTTMMTANSDAFLNGDWDASLPRVMREIANHSLKTIEVLNREEGIGR